MERNGPQLSARDDFLKGVTLEIDPVEGSLQFVAGVKSAQTCAWIKAN